MYIFLFLFKVCKYLIVKFKLLMEIIVMGFMFLVFIFCEKYLYLLIIYDILK